MKFNETNTMVFQNCIFFLYKVETPIAKNWKDQEGEKKTPLCTHFAFSYTFLPGYHQRRQNPRKSLGLTDLEKQLLQWPFI